MKSAFLAIIFLLLLFNLFAQPEPAGVCTYPSTYSFDEEVIWYFDLSGNLQVNPGDNLFFWSWEPVELPLEQIDFSVYN